MKPTTIQITKSAAKPNIKTKSATKFRGSIKPIVDEFLSESNEAQLAGVLIRQAEDLEIDIPILNKKIETLKRITMIGAEVETTSHLGKKLGKILDKAIQAATKNKCDQKDGEDVISAIKSEITALKQELNKTKRAKEKAIGNKFSFKEH